MTTAKKTSAKKTTAKKTATAKPTKSTQKKSAPGSPRTSPAKAVDEQLARYRKMRDFSVTAEPSGSTRKTKGQATLPFVIQKHAASHLHYDFRLGWNGVLKSWAVAKGPSYFTGDRRLAVQVEDHPIEYGGFEGTIPKGQYGGGTVMLWDHGTWRPQPGYEDVDAALRDGSLKFELEGKKLHGKWTLVRMHEKPGSRWSRSDKPNWLLIKEHDKFERAKDAAAITEQKPDSALTGRTMEQIAAHEDHVWNSKETVTSGKKNRKEVRSKPPPDSSKNPSLKSLPKESQPAFLPPQLAIETPEPPAGEGWLHELKLDGYRMQAHKSGAKVRLLTRKGLDWTHRMPEIAEAVSRLPANNTTLDGEVVVLSEDGTTSFANLQASFQDKAAHERTYFVFDLLHLEGRNPRSLPLRERKALLAPLLSDPHGIVRLSEHIETEGLELFHKACSLQAEGIVSKRADAPYHAGRASDWAKSKCRLEQEFVIAGYTDSTEGPGRIGSLLLGYYEDQHLIYAGRTGTGFTQKLKRDLYQQLSKLASKAAPFKTVPMDARRDAHWVHPKLVAQVAFATWTNDHLVRQAAFLGLREDKPATEVVREKQSVPQAASQSSRKASLKHPVPLAAKKVTSKPAPAKTTNQAAIRLTHPDKILDAESKVTKRQLADYYSAVAEHMLPHIANRPLSLVRCPDGTGHPCFFQKHVNNMLPTGIESVMVKDKKSGKEEPYITLSTTDAIVELAQIGVLEIHPWGSRNNHLEHPDRLIFDLDPDPSLSWPLLAEAAREIRTRLTKLGLTSFLKTTGGKGLHVVAPIQPTLTWDAVKTASHQLVLAMERDSPDLYLTKMTKSARAGKIFLDYLRNERGATAVAPYSPRARPGMQVSLPLPWSALKLRSRPSFSVQNFSDWRKSLRSDPWRKMLSVRQTLVEASKTASVK